MFTPLTLKEMGISLEEDTPDFEPVDATETESKDDFVEKVLIVLQSSMDYAAQFTLLRKSGILYCRMGVEGQKTCLFSLPWLKGPTHEFSV